MLNFFNSYNKLRTDGYYIGNKMGFSELMNSHYNIYFTMIFNKHGIAIYFESENEPAKLSLDEFKEFQGYTNYNKFSDCSRYELIKDKIKMIFYDTDSPKDYKEGNINVDNYREWSGRVTNNGLLLSFYKSSFNYALIDYSKECYFSNLEFKFDEI